MDAAAISEELVMTAMAHLGPTHQNTNRYMKNAAVVLGNLRFRDQISQNARRQLFEELISAQMQTLGARHADTLKSQVDLTLLLTEAGV